MKLPPWFRFFQPLLKNKYSLSLILFFGWLIFLDGDSLIDRAVALRKVHQLEKEKIYFQQRIEADRTKLRELESNSENLEKFAREQYLMKKDNEDIFIIEK